jgi:hypothetical protein
MRDQIEKLGIGLDVLERDRDFRRSLGLAYQAAVEHAETRQRRNDYLAFAATNCRRAAAHSMLLDDWESAAKLFREAAGAYASLRLPYMLMMTTLAVGRTPEANWREFISFLEGPRPRPVDRQGAYLLLVHSAVSATPRLEEPIAKLRQELQAAQASPMGVLGIPVGAYLELAEAFSSRQSSLEQALLPFIGAYDSALRLAMRRHYHWSRLALPFHPAEPDILSVLVLARSRALRRDNESIVHVVKNSPFHPLTKDVLLDVLERLPEH